MSDSLPPEGATVGPLPPPQPRQPRQLDGVLRRFEAACADWVRGGAAPEADAFLAELDAVDVLVARAEFGRIVAVYRERLSGSLAPPAAQTTPAGGDATVAFAPPAPAPAPDASATHVVASADGSTGAPADTGQATVDGPRPRRRREAAALPEVAGYELLGKLGRGAMGVVYRAQQRALKRDVALKMILAGDHATPRDLHRFRTEAEAVARLQHPNIVQIYEVGEADGLPFFSLEYVDGPSLARHTAGSPMAPRAAAEMVAILARAMQYAHDRGVVHRDLKPSNVLLTPAGQPKIADFGLAKRLGDESGQTHAGSVLGTPSYMPPEQADGRGDVGPLADVYALGAILYELLTGRAPFRAATLLETLDQVRGREPVPPAQLQPGTPRDLETICLKCLRKDPARRYGGAGALADDLWHFLKGEPISARPVPAWERGWRWCRRNRGVAALAAVVVALLVLALTGSLAFSAVLMREKAATEEALRIAGDNLRLAQKNQAEAEANAARARKNAAAAVDRQYAAVKHLLSMSQETQKKLRRTSANAQLEPALRPVRAELLESMRQHLLGLAREIGQAEVTSFGTTFAHQAMGDTFRDLGMVAEAMQQYELAEKLARQAARDLPEEDRGRANWALTLARLGDMEIELRGDVPRALAHYQEALRLQEDVEAHPRNHFYKEVDHQRLQANYHFKVGEARRLAGDPAAARTHFAQAVKLRRAWSGAAPESLPALGFLAEACLWQAEVCGRLDDAAAMQAGFREGIALVEEILKRKQHYDFKADLAEASLMAAESAYRRGAYDETRPLVAKCPPLLVAAINRDPDNLRYLSLIVRMRYLQGLLARQANDAGTAAGQFADALKWQEKRMAIDAESLPQRAVAAACLARAGLTADALARAAALQPRAEKDPDVLVRLAGVYALCADATDDAAARRRHTDAALDLLRTVVRGGYKDAVTLRTHPDLAPRAAAPEFVDIVSKIR